MLDQSSRPADDNESRFFRWCWQQLSDAQQDGMWAVAQTGCPNGTGMSTATRHRLEIAGMIRLESFGDEWRSTFTDLGESVMWEGAIAAGRIDG